MSGMRDLMKMNGIPFIFIFIFLVILQWGAANIFQDETTINLSISFTNVLYKVLLQGRDGSYTYHTQIPLVGPQDLASFKAKVPSYGINFWWLVIGK